jgi:cell division protein FtsI (penicillin-binding protein 3)
MNDLKPIRAATMLALLAIILVAVAVRAVRLQAGLPTPAEALAERQQHGQRPLPARRGTIFDTGGNVLAATVPSRHVFIDPAFFHQHADADPAAADAGLERLAEVLGLDALTLARTVGGRRADRYVILRRHVDESMANEATALDLPGVGTTAAQQRFYPMGQMAAHLLGGVNSASVGLEGLELQLDGQLAAGDGIRRWRRDGRRNPLMLAAADVQPPKHGAGIVLTLDANIQRIAEAELAAACKEFAAPRGECVVLDPHTGDILALAVWPGFDPATPGDATPDRRRNRAVVDPYEPGSVLKPFTVAAALDSGATTPDEVWPIHGPVWRTSYGRRITDVHPYETLSTRDVIVKSSNIGMARLAARLGPHELRSGLARFGFGRATGADLPGEGRGLLRPVAGWSTYTPESVAQGYELLVTPMQLARAVAALANGGRLVTPRIVRGRLAADGQVQPGEPTAMAQVITPQIAAEVLSMLGEVVERGTARHAADERYKLFGKTGTAHQAKNGQYDEEHYAATFIGGGPLEAPRLVIALVIHEPDKTISHFGGIVAAPAAGRILTRSLHYLNVPPSPVAATTTQD